MCANGLLQSPPPLPLAFWRFQNVPCLSPSKSQLGALGKYRARKTTAMLMFSTCWKNQELATDPSWFWRGCCGPERAGHLSQAGRWSVGRSGLSWELWQWPQGHQLAVFPAAGQRDMSPRFPDFKIETQRPGPLGSLELEVRSAGVRGWVCV